MSPPFLLEEGTRGLSGGWLEILHSRELKKRVKAFGFWLRFLDHCIKNAAACRLLLVYHPDGQNRAEGQKSRTWCGILSALFLGQP